MTWSWPCLPRYGLNLLKNKGYKTKHLQIRKEGEFQDHQKQLTKVLLNFTNDPHFFTVFYPPFGDVKLRPDACLVFLNGQKHKIQFLEIERTEKTDPDYLLKKKAKYEELARSYWLYDSWWRKWAGVFKLPMCDVEQFKFSVLIVGNVKYDWGERFEWKKKL